jgi:hypothetical protein
VRGRSLESKVMAEGLVPVALAMVVCDAIHIDPATGKRFLLGTLWSFVSREFPLVVPSLAVYVVLTECRGSFPVVLQMIDVNEERDPVFRLEGEIPSTDPLIELEVDFRPGSFQIPEPGEYRLQLYAAGAPIIERRIMAVLDTSLEQPYE